MPLDKLLTNNAMKHLISYAVLFLVIIGLSYSLYCENQEKNIVKAEVTEKEKLVETAGALVEAYKDKTNVEHSKYKIPAPVTQNVLSGGTAVISKPLLDSILNIVNKNGIKPKQLEAWYRIAMSSEARALKAEVKVDSLKRVVSYYYNSKYLNMTFTPPMLGDTTSQGTFGYRYNTLLDITQFSERNKFLGLRIGANESYVDIANQDTNATVNGLRSILVKTERSKFELSMPTVALYNTHIGQVTVGQGLGIRYGKLSVVGAYAYNVSTRKTAPYVGFGINWLK